MENVLAISETTYQQLATLAGQQHCTPEDMLQRCVAAYAARDAVGAASRAMQGSARDAPGERRTEQTAPAQSLRMTPTQLETRLLAVETALAEIQRCLATLVPAPHWLDAMVGSCKNHPAFEEAMAFGRAFREAQPYPEDLETST